MSQHTEAFLCSICMYLIGLDMLMCPGCTLLVTQSQMEYAMAKSQTWIE